MNSIHLGYNMHSIYYFAAGHDFDTLKCGAFEREPGLTVATIGFPLPTIIKPWFAIASFASLFLYPSVLVIFVFYLFFIYFLCEFLFFFVNTYVGTGGHRWWATPRPGMTCGPI